MRAAPGAIPLFLLLLLVPSTLAQVPGVPSGPPPMIEVQMGTFAAPVVPGTASQTTTATIVVSCALAATSPQTGLVVLIEATGPTWATVFVDPPAASVDPKTCTGPTVSIPATVAALAKFEGAAGDTGDVTLRASASSQAGEQSGQGTAPLTLGYHGALELKANATRSTITSLTSGSVTLSIKNNGNARSAISFVVTGTGAVAVDAIDPVVLDAGASAEKTLTFRSLKEVGPSGQTDPISVNATAKRDGGTELGASRKVEVIVATKAPPAPAEDEKKGLPGPEMAALVAAFALLALGRRRR